MKSQTNGEQRDWIATELGRIPPDWKITTLRESGKARYGLGQPPQQADDGVPMIRATNIKRGRIVRDGLIRIKRNAIPESRNPYLKGGDIVVVRSGAYTGDVAMVTTEWAGAVAGYDLVFSPSASLAPDYCACVLLSERVQNYFHGERARSAQPHLNRHQLEHTIIPLPPLEEQRKIAAVLGLVQRAMEQQERLLELTAELKKALLHQLFTHGLRHEPQKQTEIGPIPQSWEVVKFEEFALLQRGFDLPKSDFREGPYPVIGATTTIGYHHTFNVRGPGVTVVRSGSSAGKPQFIATDFWAHNVVLFVKNFHGHNPKFVYYKIQHLDLTKYREGVAVPTLNRNSFRLIPIAVPKRDEQDEFVLTLDAIEAKESVHRREHAALSALFRTLLHELMTARIRVHDLDLPELETLAERGQPCPPVAAEFAQADRAVRAPS